MLALGLIIATTATDFYVNAPTMSCTHTNGTTNQHCDDGSTFNNLGTSANFTLQKNSTHTCWMNYINGTLNETSCNR